MSGIIHIIMIICTCRSQSILLFFPDIDECAVGEDNCHDTLATCSDVVGGDRSFECTCIAGYIGDGVSCTG